MMIDDNKLVDSSYKVKPQNMFCGKTKQSIKYT